ncbi:MAG: VOC family protein [Actinomycetota bacterium]
MSDERPPVWVGHLVLPATNLEESYAFWTAVGMRPIEQNDKVAILELRGGTHLILTAETEPPPATGVPFDLMVEDIHATHTEWDDLGLGPGPIEQGRNHEWLVVRDPDGRELLVNSTHVVGPV